MTPKEKGRGATPKSTTDNIGPSTTTGRSVEEQFRDAIRAAGLTPPRVIEADGKLHRFASNGKHSDDAGWYVLHTDGIPAGSFGDWRTGYSESWRADIGRPLTPVEEATHRAKVEAMQAEREAEVNRRQLEAARKAKTIWEMATDAPEDHPYLTRKGVRAYGIRYRKEGLLIPMQSDDLIHSLQVIYPDGSKRFLPGGRVTGCYHPLGSSEDFRQAGLVCIAEGYATAASIHEATGYPVVVAFNAGNLMPVARALRARRPDQRLLLCGDDDHWTEGNPGRTKAMEAAQAVGGILALPDFGPDRPKGMKDFNDLAQLRGPDAVRQCVQAAVQGTAEEPQAYASESGPTVDLVRASDLSPEPITWLWKDWLAAGKMHILGGAPGTGKTTISIALAATVSSGGCWPDGTRSVAGNVMIWSGEDDPADTLVPRLALAGADLSRVFFISGVQDGAERRAFDPARDMEALRRRLVAVGNIRLLIIDPIVSAIVGDSHKNAEVRRGLQPLADLAANLHFALLGITHFSKGTGGRDPVERLTGSLAFGALARIVLVAAKHQEEGEDGRMSRLFCRAKSNIGPDDGGFDYDLYQTELKSHPGIFSTAVSWGNPVEGSARELLATADAVGDDGEGGTLADAKRFLVDLLMQGPLPTKAIRADADGAGFSWATIRRAQKALGVEALKEGGHFGAGKQQWVWRLPVSEGAQAERVQDNSLKVPNSAEDAQQEGLSPFSNSEHLQGDSDWKEVTV